MSEEISQHVLNTINRLETGRKNQTEIDRLWGEIKMLFLNEMSKLPDLPTSSNKKSNRSFKKSQPFWNTDLEQLWKEVCRTERLYLQFTVSNNGQLDWKNIWGQILKVLRSCLTKNSGILNANNLLIILLICGLSWKGWVSHPILELH